MKPLKSTKGLTILFVGLLIVGCASVPDEYDEEMDRINKSHEELFWEEHRLNTANEFWEKDRLKYKQDLENWEKDMVACNQKEINLIKRMNNEQLEIYSKYEESIKNNIIAKEELNLRKLKTTLTDKQKRELFNIFEITKSLEGGRKELIIEQNELTERKQKIVNDIDRFEERKNAHNRYIRMRIAQLGGAPPSSPSSNLLFAVQNSLQQWQQSLQQEQQRMQMYSINNSLRDIASAIRGY